MSYQTYTTTYPSPLATTTHLSTPTGTLHVHAGVPNPARPWEVHAYYPDAPPTLYQHTVPLPPISSTGSSALNPLLEWVPHPSIMYTLYEHPSSAQPDRRRSQKGWYKEPATYPHSSHITIRVPSLDRPIVVHSSSASMVTVQDVLTTVHTELRNEVYHHLCTSGAWTPYTNAMQVEEDIQRGVTRLLGGRVMWDGLTPSKSERDVWVLRVR